MNVSHKNHLHAKTHEAQRICRNEVITTDNPYVNLECLDDDNVSPQMLENFKDWLVEWGLPSTAAVDVWTTREVEAAHARGLAPAGLKINGMEDDDEIFVGFVPESKNDADDDGAQVTEVAVNVPEDANGSTWFSESSVDRDRKALGSYGRVTAHELARLQSYNVGEALKILVTPASELTSEMVVGPIEEMGASQRKLAALTRVLELIADEIQIVSTGQGR